MNITPGNVVRGNQKLCKWNPYMLAASHDIWIYKLSTTVNAPWIFLFVNFHRYVGGGGGGLKSDIITITLSHHIRGYCTGSGNQCCKS